jgi:2-methylcitrate dehydratase
MTTSDSPDVLALLGRAASQLRIEDLPPEVLMRAKQRVLDTIGCLVAGYNAGIADAVRDYVHAHGGNPDVTLLPGGEKTTVALASLAHATYIHGLELSDAAPRGTVHPGNEVVPVALSMAEKLKLGGASVIAATVAGYEIEIRFGRALFPSAFYRGWWTPGFFGPIGSASAAAHAMGLDATAFDNTIGIVLNLMPSAMARANEEGETIKWLIGGQAAMTGVLAAEMAKRGTKGMRDVVKGWLPVIADGVLPERLTEGITPDGKFTVWEVATNIVTKHYATVGPLTSSLDATFDMVLENDLQADDIAEIHVDAMRRTAIFNTRHPENEVTARASLPYCIAVAVCTRDRAMLLGPGFSKEYLESKAVWAAAEKVHITENEDYERQYPARSLARVTLKLKNGKVLTKEVDRSARGRYLTPTDADIEEKFRLIAMPALGKARTDRVLELCSRLETLPNVNELIAALRVQS